MWQRLSFDQSKAHRMYEKHCSFWNINHCPAARCFFASHFSFFLHPAFSRFAPLCEPCQSKHHNIYSVYPVAESVFFSAYQMLSSDFTKEFVTHSFGRWLDPVKLSSVNKKKVQQQQQQSGRCRYDECAIITRNAIILSNCILLTNEER